MKLRNVLGAAAGTVGLTAVANRVLLRSGDPFEPFLPGEEQSYRWRGFDVGYVEAGDPDDPDLVLLHGINAAASNHEFHAVFEQLTEDYHVTAPDLPGFGHSDRPPLLYSASLLTNFVTDFLADESEDPVVVASSLTGSYAALAAREVPVDRLVLVAPTDTTMGGRRNWKRTLLRSPLLGQGIYNAIVSNYSLKHFHEDHGYYDMDNLTSDVLAYEWATSHHPGARFAPASFVTGFLDPEADLGVVLGELDVPITLVWGRKAGISPLGDGRALADEADARLVVFDDSLLLPHIEHPEKFVDVVRGEYETVIAEPKGTETMVAWDEVVAELSEAGYPGFEYDSGRTAVPGLSGEWLIGSIPRSGGLSRTRLPIHLRVLDWLPGGGAVDVDPDRAPTGLRRIAEAHGLSVVIVSCETDAARVALCDRQ